MNPLLNAIVNMLQSQNKGQPPPQQPMQANQQQAPMQSQPMQQPAQGGGGMLQKILGIVDAGLSAQPQYAESGLNSERLKAARLENQNTPLMNALNNMLKQQQIQKMGITNQYLPQTLESANALKQIQSQLMPQRLDLQSRRLDLDQRRFSPEQLDALLKYRQSLISTAPQRASTAEGKHAYERANLESGFAPGGNTFQQAVGSLSGQNQALPLSPQQIEKLQSIFPQQQQGAQNIPPQIQGALQQVLQQQMPQQQQQSMQQPVPANQNNLPPQGLQQQTPQLVRTDVGDFIAPQYANNPNLLQYDVMANKKAIPGQVQNQFAAARQLEGYANDPDVRKSLLAFTKYAGILGQGQKVLDALKRDKPEQYQRALEAQKITITNLSNLARRFENLGVQESTRDEIRGTLDGAVRQMTNDPKTALFLINAALRQMNTVATQVYGAAQPIRKVYSPHEFKPLSMDELNKNSASTAATSKTSQYSQEDIEHTAKTHNMTIEQVKQKLGVS